MSNNFASSSEAMLYFKAMLDSKLQRGLYNPLLVFI